jgi:hypothetical protein
MAFIEGALGGIAKDRASLVITGNHHESLVF